MAGIGFIIAHEITHAFDDLGRQFNFNGNLIDWWREETARNFMSKAKCIIDQVNFFREEKNRSSLFSIPSSSFFSPVLWLHRHQLEAEGDVDCTFPSITISNEILLIFQN